MYSLLSRLPSSHSVHKRGFLFFLRLCRCFLVLISQVNHSKLPSQCVSCCYVQRHTTFPTAVHAPPHPDGCMVHESTRRSNTAPVLLSLFNSIQPTVANVDCSSPRRTPHVHTTTTTTNASTSISTSTRTDTTRHDTRRQRRCCSSALPAPRTARAGRRPSPRRRRSWRPPPMTTRERCEV